MNQTLKNLKKLHILGMLSKDAKLEVEKRLKERLETYASEGNSRISFG
ncbi:hypothetical protein Aeqsu_2403 [Aequorivita sublithincola DSM 14238]|uniref:Uncharacterized protein n=1 Tax=Aequorivita sublithincola (strain DSM 14238 / LMG 21431 / ACAM 643 / 9-3) TaxID=746697 RepID=I3YXZ5_AEQSU|nr:hypothetical protein [Aequorivita sublithincola]AFL81863.1 hypothetical protein Aeqsu_2403 [Aequorivita sublithincola DSM 14238]